WASAASMNARIDTDETPWASGLLRGSADPADTDAAENVVEHASRVAIRSVFMRVTWGCTGNSLDERGWRPFRLPLAERQAEFYQNGRDRPHPLRPLEMARRLLDPRVLYRRNRQSGLSSM